MIISSSPFLFSMLTFLWFLTASVYIKMKKPNAASGREERGGRGLLKGSGGEARGGDYSGPKCSDRMGWAG